MPVGAPIEVKVVYSAGKRGTRRTRALRPGNTTAGVGLLLVGLINVLVAAGLYHFTWQVSDPHLRAHLFGVMPLPPDVEAGLEKLFAKQPNKTGAQPPAAVSFTSADQQALRDAATRVGGPLIAWEFFNTATMCVLMLGAGVSVGLWRKSSWRRLGALVAIASIVALAGGIAYVWFTYGVKYKVSHLRLVPVGLMVLAAGTGLLVSRGGKFVNYCSAVMLTLAGLVTAAGLYYSVEVTGMFRASDFPIAFWPFLACVFLAISLWGWILFPLTKRLSFR